MKMIKVRLYTEEEYSHATCLDCNGRHDHVFDYKSSFDSFLYNLHNSCALPFRDTESLRLLKEVYNITFISDDDWYTVMWDNERTCISAIREDLKFALMVVEFSRRGRYTWFFPVGEKVWSILADMPFDILIGWYINNIGICNPAISGVDYQIMNYPYGGKTIEVTVKDRIPYNDSSYVRVSEAKYYTTSYKLHVRNEDGKYYMDRWGLKYALQYYWKNDIEGIIEYIGKKESRLHLAEFSQVYNNVFEFAKALGKEENAILELEYLDIMRGIEDVEDKEWLAEVVKMHQSGEAYQEYLFFRDKFKVISHIIVTPGGTIFRKLPILMVDKNSDGSYWIHGGLTLKYPEFHEAIGSVIEKRNKDGEMIALVIDTEELLDSVRDIDRAVYGFRTMPDSIEIFDVEDAVQLFGQMLKEAVASGRCKVDYEFY